MQNDYGNWCPEIYRGLFIDRFNDKQIKVAPCCAAEPVIENSTNFNFETSPYLTKLRDQFSRGEHPRECRQCWDAEKCGNKSRRQGAIEFFNRPQEEPDKVVLEGIDYNSTWACNLACVICGPLYSSSWATDLNLTKRELLQIGRLHRNNNNILKQLDLSHVKKIHFNGGEPLLNKDQIEILLQLEQAEVLKDTFISYNTNGTVMPDPAIMELWSKAKLVMVYFSIDAVGKAFEYIRQPGKWDEVSANLLKMKAIMPSNVMFGFNITVGSHNIFELDDLYIWIQENLLTNREGDLTTICWQLAYNFSLSELPYQAKLDAIKYLKPIEFYKGLVNHIISTLDTHNDNKWTAKLDSIDSRRNTSWKEALTVSKYY